VFREHARYFSNTLLLGSEDTPVPGDDIEVFIYYDRVDEAELP